MARAMRKQPLYDQLCDHLKAKIEEDLKPGDRLMSERDLAERYGLSRTTVRLALTELESLGLVVRRQGQGTFVSDNIRTPANLLHAYSFTEQMQRMGRVPQTRILDFKIIEASKLVVDRMQLNLGDKVYLLKRLRLADGVPMMVETTYLPQKVFAHLSIQKVRSKPLYRLFEEDFHIINEVAEEEFYASLAFGKDAEILGLREGAAALKLVRTTRSNRGTIVEFTQSAARADQFTYQVSHVRSSH